MDSTLKDCAIAYMLNDIKVTTSLVNVADHYVTEASRASVDEFTKYLIDKISEDLKVPMPENIGKSAPQEPSRALALASYPDWTPPSRPPLQSYTISTSRPLEPVYSFGDTTFMAGPRTKTITAKYTDQDGYVTTKYTDQDGYVTTKYTDQDGYVKKVAFNSTPTQTITAKYTDQDAYVTWKYNNTPSMQAWDGGIDVCANTYLDSYPGKKITFHSTPYGQGIIAKPTPKDPLDDLGINQKAFLQRAMAMLDIMEGHKFWTEEERSMALKIGWKPKSDKIPDMSNF